MTDFSSSAADRAAATPPGGSVPAAGADQPGDPELAALVAGRGQSSRTPVGAPPEGDPELAALVAAATASSPATTAPSPVAQPAAAVPSPATPAPVPVAQPAAAAPAAAEVVAPVGAAPASIVEPAPAVAAAAAPSAATADLAAKQMVDASAPSEPAAAAEAAPAPTTGPAAAVPVSAVSAAEAAAPEPDAPSSEAEFPVVAVVPSSPDGSDEVPPRRRHSLLARFAVAFVLGILLVAGVGAGALYAWGQQYDGRVLPGVHIGATDLSGMTRDQAAAAITKAYGSLSNGKIVLTGPEGQTTISYADIGRGPDLAGLLDAALNAGRQGELFADLIGGPQAALHGMTLAPAVTYDRAKLSAAIDRLAGGIDQAAVNASVQISPDGSSFSVTDAQNGRAIDRVSLVAGLDRQLISLNAPAQITAEVPVNVVTPEILTTTADQAKAAADRMAADLVITRGTDSWTIPGSSLRSLITFAIAQDGSVAPSFNGSGLDPLVAGLAGQVNQKVQDATLRLVNNHVVASGQSREGRTLDVAGMKAAIVAQMAARQAGTAVEPLAAVVKAVQPKLSSAQATAYAAKMVPISSYKIYYWVLINNHWGGNIEGPANRINGTVIPAGGVFDFWKVVGDLHTIPGVGPGNAIEGGKITLTGAFGGGICTTSTTLFNAALHAGMIPGARQNHNEFIDRYPPGLDATVWIVDNARQTMSFTNDTPYPILIQRTIIPDGNRRWLKFTIWSVPNGRTFKTSNLIIQPNGTAIDTVVKDPTHPKGWSLRINTPANGYKVWITISIYDHGKLHFRKTYFSNYPPVNGVLQVGTG